MNEVISQVTGEMPAIPYEDLMLEEPVEKVEGEFKMRGMRCEDCDNRMIGRRYVCSACMSRRVKEYWFGPKGYVYCSSQIHVSRTEKVPFLLAYVDLEGGARALAKVLVDGDRLADGTEVQLTADVKDWYVSPAPASEGE